MAEEENTLLDSSSTRLQSTRVLEKMADEQIAVDMPPSPHNTGQGVETSSQNGVQGVQMSSSSGVDASGPRCKAGAIARRARTAARSI